MLDFLAYLELERGLSRNTLDAYRTDLLQYGALPRRARPRRDRRPSAADVADFLAELATRATATAAPPCSPATIHRKAACLRSFYRHLRREELIDDDPTASLAPPRRGAQAAAGAQHARGARSCSTQPRGDRADRAARPGAARADVRAAGCAPRRRSGSRSATSTSSAAFVRARGKGSKERIVPVGRKAARGDRALPALRPAGAGRRRATSASCSSTSAAGR